ncbi:MAG: hypothetical protein JSW58_15125 [Candidatus Latescibacterota bacterium]|nr:MAG: hypothetical protein JSW58_15125 [Candidatus Latescibacterota bacterium]
MLRTNHIRTLPLLLVMFLAVAIVAGCGGKQGKKGENGVEEDDVIVVTGKVSLRGSTPFTLLLLEAKDGTNYMIDSSPIAEELKLLEGMELAVTARVLPEVKGDTPALSVQYYDLLPLPTGERPIVGRIATYPPDDVWLITETETAWAVEGDFKTVLLGFRGAKVWVVGDRTGPTIIAGRQVREIFVTQYGLIRR